MQYKVTWVIDVDAPNVIEAAELALSVQRNHESIATMFEVQGPQGIPVMVDLQAVSTERAGVNGHGPAKPQGRWMGN